MFIQSGDRQHVFYIIYNFGVARDSTLGFGRTPIIIIIVITYIILPLFSFYILARRYCIQWLSTCTPYNYPLLNTSTATITNVYTVPNTLGTYSDYIIICTGNYFNNNCTQNYAHANYKYQGFSIIISLLETVIAS